MDLGVFIPIGNNGWIISKNSPQYKPSFELNREIVLKAEHYGFEFALSMIKLRGFGGATEFWDYNLESFTLMAGLAAVTQKIKLYASTAVLALPPAIAARMAVTIDSIAPGRFGMNIVSGWQSPEYSQMNIWPGDKYYGYRYKYAAEYVHVMKNLWEDGRSDFKGDHFKMEDCRLLPKPSAKISIVCAGQSETGMAFAAEYGDYNFLMGVGVNTPTAFAASNERLLIHASRTGRDVGAYPLFTIIADETDEAAWASWNSYKEGADMEALAWLADKSSADKNASSHSTAATMRQPDAPVNFNIGTLVGSYAKVAQMLDAVASVPGTKGIMLVFDDFVKGIEAFGQKIQPLMRCRS